MLAWWENESIAAKDYLQIIIEPWHMSRWSGGEVPSGWKTGVGYSAMHYQFIHKDIHQEFCLSFSWSKLMRYIVDSATIV